MRMPLVAGNWKMNILQQDLIESINNIDTGPNLEVAVFPPYIYLDSTYKVLCKSAIKLGAQDVSCYKQGSYTGDVSATMLKNAKCSYAIIGHSERRQWHGETNNIIYNKFLMLVAENIIPIICVGETLAEKEAGKAEAVISNQINTILTRLDDTTISSKFVVAYEPVWAIGSGKSATPEIAGYMHKYIRSLITKIDKSLGETTRILYGGSMNPENSNDLLCQQDIDGGLIGKASISADNFNSIVQVAKKIWSQ